MTLVSSNMPEKSASSAKALVTPISFSTSPREVSVEMENLGRDRSTELPERVRHREQEGQGGQ